METTVRDQRADNCAEERRPSDKMMVFLVAVTVASEPNELMASNVNAPSLFTKAPITTIVGMIRKIVT